MGLTDPMVNFGDAFRTPPTMLATVGTKVFPQAGIGVILRAERESGSTMQLRAPVAMIVYLASYLPLSVILLCQDLDFAALSRPVCSAVLLAHSSCEIPLQHAGYAIGAVILCGACFAVTLFTLVLVRPKQQILIKEAKHVPADLMNYVLPYVVSFMGLDYKDVGKLIGFLVFFLWIFLITYKSGQIILNPVLTVFGWQLYDATYSYQGGADIEHSGVILSHAGLEAGNAYRQAAIQDVLIIKSQAPVQDAPVAKAE